jgi:hypothetical protein
MKKSRKSILRSKTGSLTIEYVILLGVGALIASLLFLALRDDSIVQTLKNQVKSSITGQLTEQKDQVNTKKDDTNSSVINDYSSLSTNKQLKDSDGQPIDQSSINTTGGNGEVSNWWTSTWKTTSNWLKEQGKQYWETDIKGAFLDPVGYVSNTIGWKDIKESASQLWNNPNNYSHQVWESSATLLKQAGKDPLGAAWTLLYDHQTFMQAVNGKDEKGKPLTIWNRLFKVTDSLPLPTKITKIFSLEDKLFVHKKGCACPTELGDKKENNKPNSDPIPKSKKQIQAELDKSLDEKLNDLGIKGNRKERLENGVASNLNPNTGKVTIDSKDPTNVSVINSKGESISVKFNKEYFGKEKEVTVNGNGEKEKIPITNDGFPDLKKWTDYELELDEKHYKLKDKDQFLLSNVSLYDQILREELKENKSTKTELTNTAIDLLTNGGQSKLKTKYKSYLEKTGLKKELSISDKELNDIMNGKGSQTLKKRLESNPNLINKIEKANLDCVKKGVDPLGYTWHHHQDKGKMQLVKSKVHGAIIHLGGAEIWGLSRKK